jgi:hypothetical protein
LRCDFARVGVRLEGAAFFWVGVLFFDRDGAARPA